MRLLHPDFFVGARNNLAQPRKGREFKSGATRHRLFTLSFEGRCLTSGTFSSRLRRAPIPQTHNQSPQFKLAVRVTQVYKELSSYLYVLSGTEIPYDVGNPCVRYLQRPLW